MDRTLKLKLFAAGIAIGVFGLVNVVLSRWHKH
jgi:hypothetical protein